MNLRHIIACVMNIILISVSSFSAYATNITDPPPGVSAPPNPAERLAVVLCHLPEADHAALKGEIVNILNEQFVETHKLDIYEHDQPAHFASVQSSSTVNQWLKDALGVETAFYEATFNEAAFNNIPNEVIRLRRIYTLIPIEARIQHQLTYRLLRLLSYKALYQRVTEKIRPYRATISDMIDLAPLYEYPEFLYPPDFVADIKKTVSQKLNQKQFWIQIESKPAGASVYINEIFIGVTPLNFNLPVLGPIDSYYTIALRKPGHNLYTRKVNGHFQSQEIIQAELIPFSVHTQGSTSIPASFFSILSSRLSIDHIELSDSVITPEQLETYAQYIHNLAGPNVSHDFWILDFHSLNHTFQFCLYLSTIQEWWCESSHILTTGLRDALPHIKLTYDDLRKTTERRRQSILMRDSVQAQLASAGLEASPLPTQLPPVSRSTSFPWWLVIGASVIIGSTAVIIANTQSGSGASSRGETVRISIQTP